MHEHDLDLIADLANGTLAAGASAVEDLVRTCADCRAEYEAQLRVRRALTGLPAVAMTAAERQGVADAVFAALPTDPAPDAAPASSRGRARIPVWWRVVPVAAAAAAVLAVGGLLGGGEQTADLFTRTAAPATDETAVEEDGASLAGAPPEVAAEATSPTPLDPSRAPAGPVDSVEALVELLLERSPDGEPLDGEPLDGELFECDSVTSSPARSGITGTVDGVAIEVFLLGFDDGSPQLEAFTLPGCEPLRLPPVTDR